MEVTVRYHDVSMASAWCQHGVSMASAWRRHGVGMASAQGSYMTFVAFECMCRLSRVCREDEKEFINCCGIRTRDSIIE